MYGKLNLNHGLFGARISSSIRMKRSSSNSKMHELTLSLSNGRATNSSAVPYVYMHTRARSKSCA